jgi:hypothetical protein
MPVSPLALPSLYITSFILLVLAFFVIRMITTRGDGKFNVLKLALQKRQAALYIEANELGYATQYMSPEENQELAQKVMDFYDELTVLERAIIESEKLMQDGKVEAACDGLTKCITLAEILDVAAQNIKAPTKLLLESEKSGFESNTAEPRLKDSPYFRPMWCTQDEYAHPIVVASKGGLADLLDVLRKHSKES